MERFTRLDFELDESNKTTDKLAALDRYFREASPRDAAWALFFLTGRRIQRLFSGTQLRAVITEITHYPLWLVEECHDTVGDLAEALALLLPDREPGTSLPLHELIEKRMLPLKALPEAERREPLIQTWQEMDRRQRLVWNMLITGEYRVGVARTLVVRALAGVAGAAQAEMAHRLMGHWEPTEQDYAQLMSGAYPVRPGRPYPFFLAYPLEDAPDKLGAVDEWQFEWKWDGIRAQLIRRNGEVLIWSRGEDLVTDRFPEAREVGENLPDGTVLDGEILAWRDNQPLPFAALQRRIGRKKLDAKTLAEAPVVFMAYDMLEWQGEDWRERLLRERRARLEELAQGLPPDFTHFRLSPVVRPGSWAKLATMKERAREQAVEGFMIKRLDSPYRVGRVRGDWWKWKVEPYTIDAVLIYAQHGHGRRASLYTDYTFGVWQYGLLVPIAKAYSGLTDEEIREVDAFIRRNTLEKHGPVRAVRPELVFELAFEAIQVSTRHKSGVALRFPRMARWRRDKPPGEADRIETLQALLGTL